jgi:hypothetical protein
MMMAALLLLRASAAQGSASGAKKEDFGWMAAEMIAEGDMLSEDGPGPAAQPWTCKHPQPDGSCVHSDPTQAQWEFAQKAIPQGKPCKDCPNIVFSLTVSLPVRASLPLLPSPSTH